MEQLISALKEFEARNNISVSLIVQSDWSFGLIEFWTQDDLGSFNSLEELLKFLTDAEYELDKYGDCVRPCKLKTI